MGRPLTLPEELPSARREVESKLSGDVMRSHSCWMTALLFVLLLLPIHAADWKIRMAEDAEGKVMTELSVKKPFWVILTNISDHDLVVLNFVNPVAQYAFHLNFQFQANDGKFWVGIGSYSDSWNEMGPMTVKPMGSLAIAVDMTVGNWVGLSQLKGVMTVKVVYSNREAVKWPEFKGSAVPPLPAPWVGKIASEPITVWIR
jgi:hypothetical protein